MVPYGVVRLSLAGLLLGAVVLGCGYAPVRYGGGFGEVRSVAVATLRNDTHEAGAEYLVSDALRREFLRRRGVRLVEDPALAKEIKCSTDSEPPLRKLKRTARTWCCARWRI